jgi:cell wall-associated NlpC family hydrolase
MARIGIPIPRDSKDQLAKAPNRIRITEQEAITEGQLAFFGPEPNRIDHVGVVIPGGRILHSSGEVRIDTLTAHGIPKAAPNQDHNLPPHTHTLQAIASYI